MDMIQTFKIVQDIDEGQFEFSDNHTRGHTKKLKKPRGPGPLKSSHMNSFCIRAVIGWNNLPEDTVNSKTVLRFKTLYDRHVGN